MKRRILLVLSTFIVFLLFIAAYSNTLESPFVLDDFHSFVNAPEVHVQNWSWETVWSMAKTKFGICRWLPMLSLAMDFRAGEGKPLPFHVTNLVIHGVTFFAVFALIALLWKAHANRNEAPSSIPVVLLALGGAALWALNPVQTSAVTYIVQRMASLQTFFYVTSTVCYVAARLMVEDGRKGWCVLVLFLLSMFSALCAFLSKENALMLPVMIALTEVWFFKGTLLLRLREILRRRLITTTISGLVLLVVIGIQAPALISKISIPYTYRHFSLLERLLTEGRVVLWYVSLFFWPVPSRLSLEHDVTVSTSLFDPPTTICSLVVLGLLFVFIWFFRRAYPLITYGLLWYFVNLVIESTIVPVELVFEHRLYLPSVGLALFAVSLYVEVSSRLTSKLDIEQRVALAWSLFMICGAALSLLTFSRNEVWNSSLSVYADAAQKAPLHPRARSNYGMALFKEGRYEEGFKESEEAIALGKDRFEYHLTSASNMVVSLLIMNKSEEAAQRGEFYLRNKPQVADDGLYPRLLMAIALAHRLTGNLPRAYDCVDEALMWIRRLPFTKETRDLAEIGLREILEAARVAPVDIDGDGSQDPGELSVDAWMARAFLKWGVPDTAEDLLKKAVLNPEDAAAQQMLALLEEIRSRNQRASHDWDFGKKYLRDPFSQHNALVGLAYLVSKIPYVSNSLWCRDASRSLLERALQIDPHSADALLLLAWQDHAGGDIKAAVSRVREAIEEYPDYARAWIQLGFFLMDDPEGGNAVEAFQEGLRLYPGYPKRALVEKIIAEQGRVEESLAGDSLGETPVSGEGVLTKPLL